MCTRAAAPIANVSLLALLATSACGGSAGDTTTIDDATATTGASAEDTALDHPTIPGAALTSLPVCATRHNSDSGTSGAPAHIGNPSSPVGPSRSGTGVYSLDARTADGWSVSWVSGDALLDHTLTDSGLLSQLEPGSQLQILNRQSCQAFSGCRGFLILRDAADGHLINAEFEDQPTNLTAFSEALGVSISTEPSCAFAPVFECGMNVVQTQYRLLINTDRAQRVEPNSQLALTIDARPYTLWFGTAYTNVGDARSGCGVDSQAFWWPGGMALSITPSMPQSE